MHIYKTIFKLLYFVLNYQMLFITKMTTLQLNVMFIQEMQTFKQASHLVENKTTALENATGVHSYARHRSRMDTWEG